MLKKAHRLSTREFALTALRGREAFSSFFSVKFVPSSAPKISAVAPKKLWKTAVSRNKVRRRIYAAARSLELPETIGNYFAVVIAKKSVDSLDSTGLSSALRDLFVKARLIG